MFEFIPSISNKDTSDEGWDKEAPETYEDPSSVVLGRDRVSPSSALSRTTHQSDHSSMLPTSRSRVFSQSPSSIPRHLDSSRTWKLPRIQTIWLNTHDDNEISDKESLKMIGLDNLELKIFTKEEDCIQFMSKMEIQNCCLILSHKCDKDFLEKEVDTGKPSDFVTTCYKPLANIRFLRT